MQIELSKPKLQKFIDEQVQAGHFPSAQAAVETAVEQMMLDHRVLDDRAIAAIANADAQYERGEFVEWSEMRSAARAG
jgi:Arc/MetJ-type ribon-helix-helix transcriptional regulator